MIRTCWQSPSAPRPHPHARPGPISASKARHVPRSPLSSATKAGNADHNVPSGVDVHARAWVHGLRYLTKVR